MIPVEFDPGAVNATVYAAKIGDSMQVIILNKDSEHKLTIKLNGISDIGVEVLQASSLTSKDVMFLDVNVSVNHSGRPASTKSPSYFGLGIDGDIGVVPKSSALWMRVTPTK